MSSETKVVPWKNLGKSGLKISNVIVGFAAFGSKDWSEWVEDDEEKIFKILKKAYDYGIRTYDTADSYSNGLSETILGKFLKKYNIKRDKVVILTKVFSPVDESLGYERLNNEFRAVKLTEVQEVGLLNNKGLSRRHIIEAAENSVRRLGTYIDVYQIHRFDPSTPPEETLRALNDVVEKGLARYIGASTTRAVEFVELQHIAEKNGWHKFVSVQSYYNLLNREDENELNYYANKTGVGIIPWAPLAHGLLTRPVPKDESELTLRQKVSGTSWGFIAGDAGRAVDSEIIKRVGEIAERKNVSRASVATAWVISKGAAPIVGLSSESRIDDLVVGSTLKLTEEEIKYLEEPYVPKARVYK